jgi:hypothetical protein
MAEKSWLRMEGCGAICASGVAWKCAEVVRDWHRPRDTLSQ